MATPSEAAQVPDPASGQSAAPSVAQPSDNKIDWSEDTLREHTLRYYRHAPRLTQLRPSPVLELPYFSGVGPGPFPVAAIPPAGCRQFTHKDTVLYVWRTVPSDELVDAIWRAWYPSRRGPGPPRREDTLRDGFLAAPVHVLAGAVEAVRPGAETVAAAELVDVHEALAARVQAVQGEISAPARPGLRPDGPREEFRVPEGFGDCFLIVDGRRWEDEDVRVVFREEKAANLGLDEGGGEAVEGREGWRIARMPLQEAAAAVVWKDAERRKAEAPISGYFREYF